MHLIQIMRTKTLIHIHVYTFHIIITSICAHVHEFLQELKNRTKKLRSKSAWAFSDDSEFRTVPQ